MAELRAGRKAGGPHATNAKVYPILNIVRGVVDIYYNKQFTIPALESLAISPEVLDHTSGLIRAQNLI